MDMIYKVEHGVSVLEIWKIDITLKWKMNNDTFVRDNNFYLLTVRNILLFLLSIVFITNSMILLLLKLTQW